MPKSHLELIASSLIGDACLPSPVSEFRFYEPRRWKFDYCWPDKMVALEIEGGIWTKSRHTTGSGYMADCEKYNEATLLGYKVIRVTSKQIYDGSMIKWLKIALGVENVSEQMLQAKTKSRRRQ